MTENQPDKHNKNPNAGHRERLRERVVKYGIDSLHDYELIEMLLHYAIPQRDTKPLAKELVRVFGSAERVLHADVKTLSHIKGIKEKTAVLFVLVRHLREKLVEREVAKTDIFSSWEAVLDFCRTKIGFADKENFLILLVDSKNKYLHSHIMAEGTVNKVAAYPREIASMALKHNAKSVILVHNHPSGETTPSKQDIDMTRAINKALAAIDVGLHDHLIVSVEGHSSFKTLGLLE